MNDAIGLDWASLYIGEHCVRGVCRGFSLTCKRMSLASSECGVTNAEQALVLSATTTKRLVKSMVVFVCGKAAW